MAVKKKVSTKPYTYFYWSVKKHEKPKNAPFEGVFAIPSSLSGKLLSNERGEDDSAIHNTIKIRQLVPFNIFCLLPVLLSGFARCQ